MLQNTANFCLGVRQDITMVLSMYPHSVQLTAYFCIWKFSFFLCESLKPHREEEIASFGIRIYSYMSAYMMEVKSKTRIEMSG